jgi:hypothetical protein
MPALLLAVLVLPLLLVGIQVSREGISSSRWNSRARVAA